LKNFAYRVAIKNAALTPDTTGSICDPMESRTGLDANIPTQIKEEKRAMKKK
jgi:hypothetical protein